MFMKVMAAILVFLVAVFVGFFVLLVLVAVDAQYSDEEPSRTYYYGNDKNEGDEDADHGDPRTYAFGRNVINDDFSAYISEMSSDADGSQSCISVDVDPLGDGQFSLWVDTRCEE